MLHLQPSKAVIASAQIEPACPGTQGGGFRQIATFNLIRLLLRESISVWGEPAGRGEEQAAMTRAFRQEALDELEAERQGGLDQLGIVIGREGGTAVRQGVAELVNRDLLNGAPAAGRQQHGNRKQERQS